MSKTYASEWEINRQEMHGKRCILRLLRAKEIDAQDAREAMLEIERKACDRRGLLIREILKTL